MERAVNNVFDTKVQKKKINYDPRTKAIIVITFLTSVLYSSNIYLLSSLTVVSFSLVIITKPKIKFTLASIFFLSLFSLIATLLANITLDIENVYLLYAIIFCRFVTIFLIIAWFFYTVEPYELAISMEKMYIPAALVWFFITIYQYFPITAKEAQEINEIRKIRGLSAKKWQIRKQFYILKKSLKPLVVGSINRGIDLAEAMTIKGFIPKKRKNYYINIKLKLIDILTMLLSIAGLVLVILYLK